MRISELQGYKSHPLHKAAQQVLGRGHQPDSSGTDPLDRFDDFMTQHGFKLVGSGGYGNVYEKSGYPWVFKIFMDDPNYLWYANWSAEHQDNPNVPKMKGRPMKIAPGTYVVRIENLRRMPVNGSIHDHLIGMVRTKSRPGQLHDHQMEWIRDEYPGVAEVLDAIKQHGSGELDLHRANWMMRGDTPVIIDPLV